MRKGMVLLLMVLLIGGQLFAASSLEELLKSVDLDYIKRSSGWLAVPVTENGRTVIVYMKQKNFGDDSSNPELKIAYFYTVIVDREEPVPAALYKKIAEINEKIEIGKVGVDKNGKTIYYISSFWIKQADEKLLLKELIAAWVQTQKLREIFEEY